MNETAISRITEAVGNLTNLEEESGRMLAFLAALGFFSTDIIVDFESLHQPFNELAPFAAAVIVYAGALLRDPEIESLRKDYLPKLGKRLAQGIVIGTAIKLNGVLGAAEGGVELGAKAGSEILSLVSEYGPEALVVLLISVPGGAALSVVTVGIQSALRKVTPKAAEFLGQLREGGGNLARRVGGGIKGFSENMLRGLGIGAATVFVSVESVLGVLERVGKHALTGGFTIKSDPEGQVGTEIDFFTRASSRLNVRNPFGDRDRNVDDVMARLHISNPDSNDEEVDVDNYSPLEEA